MVNQFMGYTVYGVTEFRPNTILFKKENETITVSMVQEALGHMIDTISKKNPIFKKYNVTLKVLRAIQVRLANRQSRRPSKGDIKLACDVLSEILKENTSDEAQRDNIDIAAFRCKMFIECFMRD